MNSANVQSERYLCIVTASAPSSDEQSIIRVFAYHAEFSELEPVSCVSRLVYEIMKSSGLPVAPVNVVVVKNDKIVKSWMPDRDYVNDDMWDTVENLIAASKNAISTSGAVDGLRKDNLN